MRIALVCAAASLAGCSTDRQLLELKRDRLLRIEQQVLATKIGVEQGSFDPRRYDVYLALDADIFERALGSFKGTTINFDASGRPIALTVQELQMKFRQGSPEVNLSVVAKDVRTGLTARLAMDSRLLIEGDLARPNTMTARIVATRLVPEVSWGPFDVAKTSFVKALLSLEAQRLTEKLPAMTIPVSSDFVFGEPARSVDSGQLATGNGSWIRGTVSYPSTRTQGAIVVRNILFLPNGIHLFANVEGL
ncbi:MAG: hypothetical protein VX205_06805 [Pseudomonadota bacterium]|nr:hypothetical protein [Sphingobium naphthae]MEC8034688.1 hypothetical protein [Pseudomonadota bacterium]|tara:strand:+ start:477 stop:1223 length:747 start_codon:yes stop_codon:yes gene_type:complete